MNNVKVIDQNQDIKKDNFSIFESLESFVSAQRMAELLAKSTVVPKEFQNNIPNAVIALEMANRHKTSPFMVMQNLYIVHGKPSWSSQYIIALINNSKRFSNLLQYEMTGKGQDLKCYAWAKDYEGNIVKGPEITMAMAKAEGWVDKNGSKWQTMPELMIRYRAASFFGKMYCADLLMGIASEEEVIDVEYQIVDSKQDVKQIIDENANKEELDFIEINKEDNSEKNEKKSEQIQIEPEF